MARTSRKKITEKPVQAVSPSQVFPTAIYARLSVENSGKDDEGAALENQIAVCEEYVKSCPHLELIETYSDNGRTGTVFDRPAFNRLMDDIRCGRIKCLVVRDFSRFGRDFVETGTYIERIFPQLDVRFIAIKENFDSFATDGSNESLMIPLQNLINYLYSKDISRKVFTALRIQMENGEFHWRKLPYGYMWNEDRTNIIPNEATAPFVRSIFAWKLEGLSFTQILDRLEAANAPIPETLQRSGRKYGGCKHGMLVEKHSVWHPEKPGIRRRLCRWQNQKGHLCRHKGNASQKPRRMVYHFGRSRGACFQRNLPGGTAYAGTGGG